MPEPAPRGNLNSPNVDPLLSKDRIGRMKGAPLIITKTIRMGGRAPVPARPQRDGGGWAGLRARTDGDAP